MKPQAAILVSIFVICLFAYRLSGSVPSAAAHPLPAPQVPHEFAGGRPGHFRFHPQEQLQADRQELGELRIGMERLRYLLPTVKDPATRQELREQLERWQVHVDRIERQLSTSAGPTASEVEARLDSIKGARSCGVCHSNGQYSEMVPTDR